MSESQMPAGFRECVTAWLREQRPDVAEIANVTGDGSDWNGDTFSGFYSSFGVEIAYIDTSGRRMSYTASGDDMESLWRHVVSSWPTEGQR